MTAQPVNLPDALAGFHEIYSPRIVARVNDYDVRIAHAQGEPPTMRGDGGRNCQV